MPQSLARILVHVVFSTKHRQPLIKPEIQDELFKYMCGILREQESPHSPLMAPKTMCIF